MSIEIAILAKLPRLILENKKKHRGVFTQGEWTDLLADFRMQNVGQLVAR